METGTINQNGQELLQKGNAKSTTHRFATIGKMRCSKCGNEYGSNSCDAHIRRCPACSDGQPSEPLDDTQGATAVQSMRNASWLLRIKTEETFGTPADIAPKSYDLYETSDSSHLVVHSRLDHDGKRRRQRAKLESVSVQKVMDGFRMLSVPVCPEVMMGCDGGYTTLSIAGSEFCWWSSPPAGWEEMDRLTGELLNLFEAALHPEQNGEASHASANSPWTEE